MRFVPSKSHEGRGHLPLDLDYHQIMAPMFQEDVDMLGWDKAAAKHSVSRGTLERFLKYPKVAGETDDGVVPSGKRLSSVQLKKLCDAAGMPYPILSAKHPDEVRYFELIQYLRIHEPDQLRETMELLEGLKQMREHRLSLIGKLNRKTTETP